MYVHEIFRSFQNCALLQESLRTKYLVGTYVFIY